MGRVWPGNRAAAMAAAASDADNRAAAMAAAAAAPAAVACAAVAAVAASSLPQEFCGLQAVAHGLGVWLGRRAEGGGGFVCVEGKLSHE
eukprot:356134-Chlamydomonas_euryale.AAC.2